MLKESYFIWKPLCEQKRRHVVTWGDASGLERKEASVVWLGHWEYTVWTCPVEVLARYNNRDDKHIGIL